MKNLSTSQAEWSFATSAYAGFYVDARSTISLLTRSLCVLECLFISFSGGLSAFPLSVCRTVQICDFPGQDQVAGHLLTADLPLVAFMEAEQGPGRSVDNYYNYYFSFKFFSFHFSPFIFALLFSYINHCFVKVCLICFTALVSSSCLPTRALLRHYSHTRF